MTPIGFDTRTGTLLIVGNDVYQARTLSASISANGMVEITSIAGRSEQYIRWDQITDLTGNTFATSDALMAYLVGEFDKAQTVGSPQRNYALALVDGQTTFPISPVPIDVNTINLIVNGAAYAPPDIAVSDLAVTWLGSFSLAASDAVRVTYF